jgi:D-alanyl-D-alanine dipeptidase
MESVPWLVDLLVMRAGFVPLEARKESDRIMSMVEITAKDFDLEIALAYATPENITGKPIYRQAVCYLQERAADKLRKAVQLAAPLGLRFKIFDAYRPTEAQWKLWEAFPSEEFVASPRKGSPHSRGVAVDLTLIDAEGRELEMGTGFDDMRAVSHHARIDIPVEAQRNRFTLMGIMSAAGWDFYKNEWWHYQLFNARDYPLIDQATLAKPLM